ncbi:hypothetical protein C8R41DRAFT_913351 [Lentinula lateritia]|uniref:Uncharacterized protein n=1 Tax=Lentinula lateritia TaxID=40482 RepID=A0ABQ8VYD0_9AGAR|nr:hypothetical protein C8R41DRAFT_913351 [Lentinula lateritia]
MSPACVSSPPSQPSSAKSQTKTTLLANTRTMNTTEPSSLLITGEFLGSKRARTISTSSVDTIRINSGKKKSTSSKKRARASEPSSGSECDQNILEDIRRIRQRKSSTYSADTIRALESPVVTFPIFCDPPERTSPQSETPSTAALKKKDPRKVTPPQLNPGKTAPSVAVTSVRHAPPPPIITNLVRSRVSSIKRPSSRPTSPAAILSNYHPTGFEPLPSHLQEWQPSSTHFMLSDDEGSACDDKASSQVTAWKDQWDHVHPGMSDLAISICFHKKQPFFDVWDLPDDIYIAVPARLHLTLKNPQQWKELPSEPDIRYIDIKCNTFEYRPLSEYYPPEYSVSYTGASSAEYADPAIIPADLTRGIIVNKRWNKTFPGNKFHFKETLITNFGRLPDDSLNTHSKDDGDSISKRGWFFKFMIPIPSWVLRQGNTRAFVVETSVWIGGLDNGGLLHGDTELVISHLRSEREMVKGVGQCA